VRTEQIVFAVAAVAAVAHLVDHLIVGVVMDLQFDSVLVFGAVTVVAAVAYPWIPWRLQAVGSIALGLGWLVGDFVLHALPTIRNGPGVTDGARGDRGWRPADWRRHCGGAPRLGSGSPALTHARGQAVWWVA
jgi:hypothetical protein